MTSFNFQAGAGSEITTTNSKYLVAYQSGLTTGATNTFIPLGGFFASTTESFSQVVVKTAGTFSNLYVNITSNTTTATSTINFRKNTSNGNGTLSIGATSTGAFEDTTDTDAVVLNDLVNLNIIVGSGGNLTPILGSVMFTASSGTVINSNFLSFM